MFQREAKAQASAMLPVPSSVGIVRSNVTSAIVLPPLPRRCGVDELCATEEDAGAGRAEDLMSREA
jgi:hypothetical protein